MGRIIALGSNPQLRRAITVSGTNNQVLPNGTLLELGQDMTAVLEEILVREVFPGYAAPVGSLGSSLAATYEVGTNVSPLLTPAFSQNDAGPLLAYRLERNGTLLGTQLTLPAFQDAYGALGPELVTYAATFGYAQGVLKLGDQGNPAPGRIAAGQVVATRTMRGLFSAFWGSSAAAPASSADVRALANAQALTGGATVLLTTGTTHRFFTIAVPAAYTLSAALDLDNFNTPVLADFTLQALTQVNDAGGTPRPYKVYTKTIANPYNPSSRLQLTFV